jgi:hypothetical protein
MFQTKKILLALLVMVILLSSFKAWKDQQKPTCFLIGDSTVKNGQGRGDGGLWGWGDYLASYFDTNKITIRNEALGGTSTRTYLTKGLWKNVLDKMQAGDYLIMQFGHNDDSPLDDTARARGTIKSNGDESKDIYNPITKQAETVYSYGWYLRKFVAEAKAKGATVIICSLIPRNNWKDGKVNRAKEGYVKWANEAASASGAFFFDLNAAIANQYDAEGQVAAQNYFTEKDHTHTNESGAILNAATVATGIKALKNCSLSNYLLKEKAAVIPSKKQTIQALSLANKYFMNKWPDAGKTIVTNKERPSNIWTRAVYYEGLMALNSIDPKQAYIDYANQWANFHKWSMRSGIKTRNADDQACGQTYIDLYQIDKNPDHIKNIKASIDSMVANPKVDDWTWVDAIQMSMPVFAKLGVLYQDTSYFNKMYAMYAHTRNKQGGSGLFNKREGLWWRDKDFLPPYKEPNGGNCYWSRGNGWVVAALVRVLSVLPKTDAHYNEYLSDYKAMMLALVPLQRTDGFWNVSLKDSTNFGGKELTGTSLFVYGLTWGVNNGILPAKKYQPILLHAWKAITTECLHADGFLGYVQGTGKEPKEAQPVTYTKQPDFEDFGLGCFLLAGAEIAKLKK